MEKYQKVKLSELIIQDTAIEKITDMKNEHYITLSSYGKGAHERVIKDGKYPVPFSGYRVSAGQFIYSRIDARNGAYDVISPELDGFVVSKDFPIFDINTNKVLPRFLLYSVSSHSFIEQVKRSSFGATNRMRIKEEIFREYSIILPPLNAQQKYIDLLDKTKDIISFRQEEMNKLDELIKARFVELFGDPVLNPLGWEVKPVIDICDCMVPGRDKPKSFTGDIPWITIDDLIVNGTTFMSKQGLGLTEAEISEVKRKTIPVGSVVMSCVGNLGICSIAGKEMIINQQLHSFQCHSEINNVFLMYYLVQRKDYMEKQASSTTVLYMNKSVCNSIPIMIPDLMLQKQFADFVKQVDKSKFEIQKSLEKTQLLFDSLMQQYFG